MSKAIVTVKEVGSDTTWEETYDKDVIVDQESAELWG